MLFPTRSARIHPIVFANRLRMVPRAINAPARVRRVVRASARAGSTWTQIATYVMTGGFTCARLAEERAGLVAIGRTGVALFHHSAADQVLPFLIHADHDEVMGPLLRLAAIDLDPRAPRLLEEVVERFAVEEPAMVDLGVFLAMTLRELARLGEGDAMIALLRQWHGQVRGCV